MKILMISSYLPYPLHSGGQVRLFNLVKELSGKHEITLICENRDHQTIEDVKAVEKICKKVITVARRKQWSIENIVKSVGSSQSFLVTGHTNLMMQKAIQQELAKQKFDLIHVETFYVMQNLVSNIPIVLVEHNIEYQVYKRFMDQTPLPVRPLLSWDIAKIKRNEEAAWSQATELVAVSDEDKKVMEQEGFSPAVVSNGVDIDKFSLKTQKKQSFDAQRKILFIGDFKWLQNRDSVKFVIEEVWPRISLKLKSENVQHTLWIVGRHIPESIRSLTNNPNVLFDEESSAKSTPEIFQEADVLLAPIRVGGGTSYKILESMACGTPVVTMPLSASAIHANDGEQLMVGKNASELAEKTVSVLNDNKLYEKIGKGGRLLIEEKYSWKTIAKELEKVYSQVVK